MRVWVSLRVPFPAAVRPWQRPQRRPCPSFPPTPSPSQPSRQAPSTSTQTEGSTEAKVKDEVSGRVLASRKRSTATALRAEKGFAPAVCLVLRACADLSSLLRLLELSLDVVLRQAVALLGIGLKRRGHGEQQQAKDQREQTFRGTTSTVRCNRSNRSYSSLDADTACCCFDPLSVDVFVYGDLEALGDGRLGSRSGADIDLDHSGSSSDGGHDRVGRVGGGVS